MTQRPTEFTNLRYAPSNSMASREPMDRDTNRYG